MKKMTLQQVIHGLYDVGLDDLGYRLDAGMCGVTMQAFLVDDPDFLIFRCGFEPDGLTVYPKEQVTASIARAWERYCRKRLPSSAAAI